MDSYRNYQTLKEARELAKQRFQCRLCLHVLILKEQLTVTGWVEAPAIAVPHLVVAVSKSLSSLYLHQLFSRCMLNTSVSWSGQNHSPWRLVTDLSVLFCLFFPWLCLLYCLDLQAKLRKPTKMCLWLSRNNTEYVAIILDEESKFYIVCFNINEMQILFAKGENILTNASNKKCKRPLKHEIMLNMLGKSKLNHNEILLLHTY